MRFLTPAWHRGDLTDDEAERVAAQYSTHRAEFAASVSGPLKDLAAGPYLHDALVVHADVNRSTRTVVLRLLVGDQQRGYFERTMRYEDVDLEQLSTQSLAVIARDPATELLYDEVDAIERGRYSHTFLFWPNYRELSFHFARVHVSDIARADRTLPPLPDRYSEAGVAAV